MALLQTLKSFVNERLSLAAEEILVEVERILTEYEDQAFSSKQQQQSILDVVLKPDTKFHIAAVLPEQQERSSRPSLIQEEAECSPVKEEQEEPECSPVKEEQEELLISEEADGSTGTLTLLAVKREEDVDENVKTEHLASASNEHMKTQADAEDCGTSQTSRGVQLLSSHCSESPMEDGDDREETKEARSTLTLRDRKARGDSVSGLNGDMDPSTPMLLPKRQKAAQTGEPGIGLSMPKRERAAQVVEPGPSTLTLKRRATPTPTGEPEIFLSMPKRERAAQLPTGPPKTEQFLRLGNQCPDIDIREFTESDILCIARKAHNNAGTFGKLIFQYAVSGQTYGRWTGTVNWDGSREKMELPQNLKKFILREVAREFPGVQKANIKEVINKVNEYLRTERTKQLLPLDNQCPDIDIREFTESDILCIARKSHNNAGTFGKLIFTYAVSVQTYRRWTGTVNWDGSREKMELPQNLKKFILREVRKKFPGVQDANIKKVIDKVNEYLRTERTKHSKRTYKII